MDSGSLVLFSVDSDFFAETSPAEISLAFKDTWLGENEQWQTILTGQASVQNAHITRPPHSWHFLPSAR